MAQRGLRRRRRALDRRGVGEVEPVGMRAGAEFALAASSSAWSWSQITTEPPSSIIRLATAKPMPEAPPVITAPIPSNRRIPAISLPLTLSAARPSRKPPATITPFRARRQAARGRVFTRRGSRRALY